MNHALSQINWLAVVMASLAHFVLGGIWFMVLFRKTYARVMGLNAESKEKPGAIFIVGPLVCSTITIATTAFLLAALRITEYGDALMLGAVVGVGFLGAMTMNIAINPLFPHPFRYTLINAPMFLIGSLMASAILVAMG